MAMREPGRSDYTPTKQRHLEHFLRLELPAARGAARKHGLNGYPRLVYIDLNAGDGIDPTTGDLGSPLIALRLAADLEIPIEAWLCEINPVSAMALEAAVAPLRSHSCAVSVLLGDHRDTVAEIVDHYAGERRRCFGLLYTDPNGVEMPVATIQRLVEVPALVKLDVLAHIAANSAYKRLRHVRERYLADDIAAVGKGRNFLRAKITAHEWTFAYLTDWPAAPVLTRIGMVDLATDAGRALMDELNLSRREREQRLPFVLGLPTAPMPSTCDTPPSLRCEPSLCAAPAGGVNDAGSGHQLKFTI